MAKVDVKCPFCQQTTPVKKHGKGNAGHQRYRCQACCRSFQPDYEYRACQQGMKTQIVDLAMNNAGIRDTARALHISINAVVRTQRIERENLNLRNRLKRLNCKTLGYSKSAEMHGKIIGTFIEREHYGL